MKNRRVRLLTVVLLSVSVIIGLCGCGKESAYDSLDATQAKNAAYDGALYSDDVYMATAEEAYADSSSGSDESVEVQETNRKLIKNVDMSVETEDMDTLVDKLNSKITSMGGYVEYSHVNNGSAGSYSDRYASITARIPAKKLDEFLGNVAQFSNITSKNINVSDVTLQYADTEARKSSLRTEQQRLLELVEQAETVEEIIYIEDRLSDVRYELESIERQLRTYDNQVDYSTVAIDIREVTKFTPTEEPTRWEKISEGFVNNLADVWEGILDFLVDFIIAIPTLTLLGVIGLIIFLIVMGNVKKSRKRRAKKVAEMQEAQAKAQAQARMQAQMQAQFQAQAQMQQSQAQMQSQAQAQSQAQPQAQSSETPKSEK